MKKRLFVVKTEVVKAAEVTASVVYPFAKAEASYTKILRTIMEL